MTSFTSVAGNTDMKTSENLSYLFKGIDKGITLLEEETYIFQALSTSGIRRGFHQVDEVDDNTFVSRWPENKFPLKIFIGPDYGYLFSPLELKQLSQIMQNALIRIQNVDPDTFKFTWVPERQQADIIIKFRRMETSFLSHCTPEIGKEKQITKAEVTINVCKNLSHSRILQDMVHNLLHALGIHGHSDNALDSGAKDWTPQQQILTPRDIKTLQLLYRCPLAMTKRELSLLWQEYQNKYLALPMNGNLDAIISSLETHDPDFAVNEAVAKTAELSTRELALQRSFNQCLKQLESA